MKESLPIKYAVFTVILLLVFSILVGCGSPTKLESPIKSEVQTSIEKKTNKPMPIDIKKPSIVNSSGTIEAAFSPNGGGEAMIIKAIGQAKNTINVQAYYFTNANIAKALRDASKRGLGVRVVLDKINETDKYSSATFFANAGIPVRIDSEFLTAHNKIMILDDETLITGSYNFSKAAEEKNAENVLVFRGNKELVALYNKNWQWRWDASKDYKRKE